MIRLTTLGAVGVSADPTDHPPLACPQAKRLALLVYLAVAHPRGPHRRDTLVALLWPDLDQARARAALRQAIHALRQSLGSEIIASNGMESIEVARAAVHCDLWDLERAARSGDHEDAGRLYTGELLPGLFVADSPGFERWLDAERARVRELVRESAWAAADGAARTGRAADVARHVRLAVSLSELDEGAIRRAMCLLAAVGERAAALSTYEAFSTRLGDELGTEPTAPTRELAAELRRSDSPGPATQRRPEPEMIVSDRPPAALPFPRRSRHRWRWTGATLAGALAVGAAAYLARSGSATVDPRRVRVAAFVNESALPVLDTVARIASISVRDALLRLDNVEVLSSNRGSDTLDGLGATTSGLRVQREGTLVRGLIRVVADSVELRAEVIDRAAGAIARAVVVRAPGTGAQSGLSSALETFGERVGVAVATALYPGWESAISVPPSYAAYRRFIDGMRLIKLERHDGAAAAFRQAFDEDSSFTAAGLLAAAEYYQMKRFAAAESIAVAIGARRSLLPLADGHLLDWLVHSLRGDRIAARAAMRSLVAIAPRAEMAWLQLAVDNVETARPREALAALDRVDVDSGFGTGWAAYWATRIEALHLMGDHVEELRIAREGLQRHPELHVLALYELRALAALGRVAEVESRVALLPGSPASTRIDAPMAMRQVALELAAHGHDAASRAMLARARAWYDERAASARSDAWLRSGYARTLWLAGEHGESQAIYRSLLRAHPACLDCIGAIGVLAARAGDRQRADSIAAVLAAADRPFLFGRHLLWQSRIASAGGDPAGAAALLASAFVAGAEFDVMIHTDPDLRAVRPDSIYRLFARAGN